MQNIELKEPFYNNEICIQEYNKNNFILRKTTAKNKRAIIFFSGNGIYYPNTSDVFEEQIIKKNYYEWLNISKNPKIQKYYNLIIFVRDINKIWYAKGINKTLNSREKVTEKLKEITTGYEITTCGNSAGGYMATYAGIKLNAKRIFNFSGQFKLEKSDCERLSKYYNEQAIDLTNFLTEKTNNLFYFLPYNVEQDKEQYNIIKKYGIKTFKFNVNKHGETVEGRCYPFILTASNEKIINLLEKFDNKIIDKHIFSKDIIPLYYRIYKKIINPFVS